MKFIALALIVAVCFATYVRIAPSDPMRWHIDPNAAKTPGTGGVLRRFPGNLAALNAAVMAEPRAKVLAGSVGEGHITYILRSRVFGFPDYVTVKRDGADLVVLSRLRIGVSDVGVNARRLDRWLQQL